MKRPIVNGSEIAAGTRKSLSTETPQNGIYTKSTKDDAKTAPDNVRRHSHQSGNGIFISRRDSRSETPGNGNQIGIYGKSAKNDLEICGTRRASQSNEIYGKRRVSFGTNGSD